MLVQTSCSYLQIESKKKINYSVYGRDARTSGGQQKLNER